MRKPFPYLFLLLFPFFSLSVYGEEEDKGKELENRLSALEEEIVNLKAQAYHPSATESYTGMGPAASKVYFVRHGVSLGGYGETLFTVEKGKPNQLDMLRLVPYIGYKFSDEFLFNSEIEFEHGFLEAEGGPGEVSVEFAYVEYLPSPYIHIRGGLLLIPMGFINELHEPVAFLSPVRPAVERWIIPTTFRENGVGLLGTVEGTPLGSFTYKLYFLNGLNGGEFSGKKGFREGRQNGGKALAEKGMVVGNLTYIPTPGIQIGGSILTGNSNQNLPLPPIRTTIGEVHGEVQIYGVHLRGLISGGWVGGVKELNEWKVSEGVKEAKPEKVTETENELRKEGIGERPFGGYVEVGYNFAPLFSLPEMTLIPYLRWERTETQGKLPEGFFHNPAYRKTFTAGGIHFKPIPQVVLKGEIVEEKTFIGKSRQFNLNLGYVF